jgi:WD40 repeat protein
MGLDAFLSLLMVSHNQSTLGLFRGILISLYYLCFAYFFNCSLLIYLNFSFQGKHLVSVGGYIYLWNWRSGMLVTKLKASSSCSAVSSVNFSSDAKFIVTAGKKHLKFWTVRSSPGNRLNAGTVSLAMHGKVVDLGPQKGSSFVSVTSHKWSGGGFVNGEQAGDFFPIYALTDTGWIYF